MSNRPRPKPGHRKAVPISQWVQQAPGRYVTRVEVINVMAILMERRLQIEKMERRQKSWLWRLGRFLASGFSRWPGKLTPGQAAAARAASLDPTTRSIELADPPEEEDDQDAEPEKPDITPEANEDGLRIIDRRTHKKEED